MKGITLETIYKKVVDLQRDVGEIKKSLIEEPQLRDDFVLRMPLFGDLLRKVALSRFSRTLATLIQSGVPILESLDIVKKTIPRQLRFTPSLNIKDQTRQ